MTNNEALVRPNRSEKLNRPLITDVVEGEQRTAMKTESGSPWRVRVAALPLLGSVGLLAWWGANALEPHVVVPAAASLVATALTLAAGVWFKRDLMPKVALHMVPRWEDPDHTVLVLTLSAENVSRVPLLVKGGRFQIFEHDPRHVRLWSDSIPFTEKFHDELKVKTPTWAPESWQPPIEALNTQKLEPGEVCRREVLYQASPGKLIHFGFQFAYGLTNTATRWLYGRADDRMSVSGWAISGNQEAVDDGVRQSKITHGT